jgi:threonine/homoserine/homoserine lactone efflux protein
MTHIFIFLWISFLVTFTPGPSVLFTVSQGMRLGFFRAMPSLLGNLLASISYGLISVSSLGYVLRSYPQILKWVALMGSGYLIISGLTVFFKSNNRYHFSEGGVKSQKNSYIKEFIDGFVVNLSNPKIMIFYLLVIPQFAINSDNIALSLIMLTLIQNLMKAGSLIFYSALANYVRHYFHTINDKIVTQLSGTMIIVLGFILMTDSITNL